LTELDYKTFIRFLLLRWETAGDHVFEARPIDVFYGVEGTRLSGDPRGVITW